MLFSKDNKPEVSINEAEIEGLYAQIGKLQVHNDFLKKKLQ